MTVSVLLRGGAADNRVVDLPAAITSAPPTVEWVAGTVTEYVRSGASTATGVAIYHPGRLLDRISLPLTSRSEAPKKTAPKKTAAKPATAKPAVPAFADDTTPAPAVQPRRRAAARKAAPRKAKDS